MGVGAHEQVFEKSTFFDSDDEEEGGGGGGSRSQASRLTSPRSKSDSRLLFRSAPKGKPRHRSRTPPLPKQPNLFDEGLFPPVSPSIGPELSSKWSALSSRLRGHNGTATKMRHKKGDSTSLSHYKGGIDMFGNAYNLPTGDEPISPGSDGQGTPRRESFSINSQEKLPEVPRKDSPNWNEARAASKALEYAVDASSHQEGRTGVSLHSKIQNSYQQSSPLSTGKGKIDLNVSPYPLRSLHSTSPLSFDVHRRPKAPFPALDTTPSREVSLKSSKSPQAKVGSPVASPQLPSYSPKINPPSRITRPSPKTSEVKAALSSRPGRRESECDIFSDAAEDFAATIPIALDASPNIRKKSSSPRQAKTNIPPRRGPPPSSAVPLPPSNTKLTLQSLALSEAMQREDAMSRIASAMLMSPSEQKQKEEKSIQVSPRKMKLKLPKRDSFGAEVMNEDFNASMPVMKCKGAVKEAKIDLMVGGVQFETTLSQLGSHDSAIDDGLMAWLKKQIAEKSKEEIPTSSLQMTKAQSVPFNLMHVKNKPSIVSCHSSLSSEEEEAEEIPQVDDNAESFYELSPISRLRWSSVDHVQDERVDPMMKIPMALEPLHLTAPLRINRSHARTPTNVSTDMDVMAENDEGEDVIARLGDSQSTPDLVGSHAFVFMSSPSHGHPSLKSPSHDNYIQINIDRNPQSYAFILHLLKHGSLPQYFFLKQFPSLERKRALLALERECAWLGYNTLADTCLSALRSL